MLAFFMRVVRNIFLTNAQQKCAGFALTRPCFTKWADISGPAAYVRNLGRV